MFAKPRISTTINRCRLHSQFLTRFNNTAGNLTSIGDENAIERSRTLGRKVMMDSLSLDAAVVVESWIDAEESIQAPDAADVADVADASSMLLTEDVMKKK